MFQTSLIGRSVTRTFSDGNTIAGKIVSAVIEEKEKGILYWIERADSGTLESSYLQDYRFWKLIPQKE